VQGECSVWALGHRFFRFLWLSKDILLPLFFNRWYCWLFITCLTIRLIQKIYVIIIYFVMSCFITHSTLSVIYILYICIKFLNKTNSQTCKKKLTASSVKKRREYYTSAIVWWEVSHGYCHQPKRRKQWNNHAS